MKATDHDGRASIVATRMTRKQKKLKHVEPWNTGYSWGAYDGWLAGYRAAQRDARRAKAVNRGLSDIPISDLCARRAARKAAKKKGRGKP